MLHVNGDDPEAVVLATQLALDFRMEFQKDVVVDISLLPQAGPQRAGHPSLTQPLMYKKIAPATPARASCTPTSWPRRAWASTLGDDMVKAQRAALDDGKNTVDPVLTNFKSKYAVDWSPYLNKKWTDAGDTAIPLGRVEAPGRDASPPCRKASPCTRW